MNDIKQKVADLVGAILGVEGLRVDGMNYLVADNPNSAEPDKYALMLGPSVIDGGLHITVFDHRHSEMIMETQIPNYEG